MTQQNAKFNFPILIAGIFLLLSALIVLVSLLSWQRVGVNCLFSSADMPLGLFGLLALITGSLTTGFVLSVVDKRKESAKTQVSWQSQDAKLIAEMVADKERLLQAKIDTLEAALKSALKKTT